MKLTPQIQSFLSRQIKLYCKQQGIKPVPVLVYSLEDLEQIESGLQRFKPKDKYALSVFDSKERHTFMNMDKHKNASELIDTLSHELVHIKYPNKQHGKQFEKLVDDVIMGVPI